MAERMSSQPDKAWLPQDIREKRAELAEELRLLRKGRDKARQNPQKTFALAGRFLGMGKPNPEQDPDLLHEKAQAKRVTGEKELKLMRQRHAEDLVNLKGFTDDENLIKWIFEKTGRGDPRLVSTDQYLNRSKEQYNAAWLSREIIQNFVDHNPEHPGTLDGVRFERELLEDGRTQRLSITGNWPFTDTTGVAKGYSEKPADINPGGGNGIGLKQAALRFMRDFDTKKFEILGQKWTANYSLVRADDLNKTLQYIGQPPDPDKPGEEKKVLHDWLIASFETTPERDFNRYIIETENPELIAAFSKMEELGVSEKNPYLQNMDYSNAQGAIKWLPPIGGEPQEGRLFINGQVMNYREQGETSADYWRGTDGVTLRLNNIANDVLKISQDRPPIEPHRLPKFIKPLIDSMATHEVIDQIKRSEPIWSTDIPQYGSAAGEVIEALVNNLRFKYNPSPEDQTQLRELAEYFEEHHYLAKKAGSQISETQLKSLQEQGYTVCPGYFANLGMPLVETRLSNYETAALQGADAFRGQREIGAVSKKTGLQVSAEYLGDDLTGKEFMTYILRQGKAFGGNIVADPQDPHKIRIYFDPNVIKVPKELLSKTSLPGKNEPQRLLNAIRTIAFHGLSRYELERVNFSQGQVVNNFSTHFDTDLMEKTLWSKEVDEPISGQPFVELVLTPNNVGLRNLLFEQSELPQSPHPAGEDWYPQTPPPGAINLAEQLPNLNTESAGPRRNAETVIVEKTLGMTDEQLNALNTHIPGIRDAIIRLSQSVAPSEQSTKQELEAEVLHYLSLRESEAGRGAFLEDQAGYLETMSLVRVMEENSQAPISPRAEIVTGTDEQQAALKEARQINQLMMEIINKVNPEGTVSDFEIVIDPEKRQLAQLGVLRSFVHFATGYHANNKIFIYNGSGSKGINIGKEAIGLHATLLNAKFKESLSTFIHEVAHNEYMNHEEGFREAMQALFANTIESLRTTALDLLDGKTIGDRERAMLELTRHWDTLRQEAR